VKLNRMRSLYFIQNNVDIYTVTPWGNLESGNVVAEFAGKANREYV